MKLTVNEEKDYESPGTGRGKFDFRVDTRWAEYSARTERRIGTGPSTKRHHSAARCPCADRSERGLGTETTELVEKIEPQRRMGEHCEVGTVIQGYRAIDNYTAVRFRPVVAPPSPGLGDEGRRYHSRTVRALPGCFAVRLGHDVAVG